ncbi:MAG: hypothetical protein AUK48_13075 [Oscillatoriales cyanobacterium CG2_30_44_21]|nr:MAG: hypothetical protein AUK48_13075 [Oscillatoriales cyanobacterium CG2_30_44_21]
MKVSSIKKIFASAIVSMGAIAISLPAQAGTLINGWNYARDDYSYDGSGSGGFNEKSRFDIYGVGFKSVGNEIWVGINSSNALNGVGSSPNVGFGDLFLDFSNGANTFAQAQGSLIGIRFAPNSDGIANTPRGVYTNVTGKSVAGANDGFPNLKNYNDGVKTATGGNSRFGDLLWTDPYYAPYTSGSGSLPNVIDRGNIVAGGNLRNLSSAELANSLFPTTINLSSTNPNTLGFAFTLPDSFKGRDFLATLGFDCSNDTIAVKPVPVPPAIAGILVAGALGGWRAANRKKQSKAA